MIVTRFAPSPTGLLHLGHALAAIIAHESGDDFLLRIEDIDKGRSRDKFIEAIFFDLKWLGLSWDEPTLRQSTRMGAYAEALANLKARGLVYPCFCTRAEIAQEIARAGKRIIGFHVCDWITPTNDFLNDRGLMGEGCIDIKSIHRAVRETGFNGFTEVEIFSTRLWATDQDQFLQNIITAHQNHVAL